MSPTKAARAYKQMHRYSASAALADARSAAKSGDKALAFFYMIIAMSSRNMARDIPVDMSQLKTPSEVGL